MGRLWGSKKEKRVPHKGAAKIECDRKVQTQLSLVKGEGYASTSCSATLCDMFEIAPLVSTDAPQTNPYKPLSANRVRAEATEAMEAAEAAMRRMD